jgi:hypothetical protein
MRDRADRVVYYLFFATNNALGHTKMKEYMWKVDPFGDFRFSDATNPDQQVLFTVSPTAGLASDLSSFFKGKPQLDVKHVERYVEDETAYLRKHMREALNLLESSGGITVADKKSDGKKRRAGTFPNGTLVHFSKN